MVIPVQTPAGLEPAFDLSAYYPILLYAAVVLVFAVGTLAASHLFPLKPRKPTGVKRMPYESGMDPVGTARLQFDVKYAMVAIMFVIFDVELLFLYPWAVVAFGEENSAAWRAAFGSTALAAVVVFLAVLALAYYYEWRKGAFTWR